MALTREEGKNGKLRSRLEACGLEAREMPCIAHSDGPDRAALPSHIAKGAAAWDYVVVTSPEAAAVFLSAWEEAGCPDLAVASVGSATSTALKLGGLEPVFEPSKATGATLAAELPVMPPAVASSLCIRFYFFPSSLASGGSGSVPPWRRAPRAV